MPPQAWPLTRDPHPFETSRPGVFAAGDVRYGSVKRVAGAVGEGSVAVDPVHRYLAELTAAPEALVTSPSSRTAPVTSRCPRTSATPLARSEIS